MEALKRTRILKKKEGGVQWWAKILTKSLTPTGPLHRNFNYGLIDFKQGYISCIPKECSINSKLLKEIFKSKKKHEKPNSVSFWWQPKVIMDILNWFCIAGLKGISSIKFLLLKSFTFLDLLQIRKTGRP